MGRSAGGAYGTGAGFGDGAEEAPTDTGTALRTGTETGTTLGGAIIEGAEVGLLAAAAARAELRAGRGVSAGAGALEESGDSGESVEESALAVEFLVVRRMV